MEEIFFKLKHYNIPLSAGINWTQTVSYLKQQKNWQHQNKNDAHIYKMLQLPKGSLIIITTVETTSNDDWASRRLQKQPDILDCANDYEY